LQISPKACVDAGSGERRPVGSLLGPWVADASGKHNSVSRKDGEAVSQARSGQITLCIHFLFTNHILHAKKATLSAKRRRMRCPHGATVERYRWTNAANTVSTLTFECISFVYRA
jgi:hypothetical protein